jgi:hypothetical protein
MLAQILNIKTAIFFLLGVLFVAVVGGKVLADKGKTELAEKPLRALNVTIDVDQREVFFEQLRIFSDKHAFAIRLAPNTPDGKSFIGQMWREDIKLVTVNPFDEGKYRVYFYQNDVPSVDDAVLNLLVSELSALLKGKGFTVDER